jgi:hypothetical protein
MSFLIRIIITLLFSSSTSVILFFIENRSNFPSIVMIPIIVGLLTKYVLGDWDKGFQMSHLDLVYWISVIGISYVTVSFLNSDVGKILSV